MYLTKKALFDHLENEMYCRLGASPVHGVGVFAFRPIPPGINPFKSWLDIDEIKFSREELKVLPASSRDVLDTFCYHNEDTVCVPVVGLNVVNISIYINHSKTPNLIMNKDGSFTSMRKIAAGEELLMDYDDSFDEEHSF